ncbi:MAG: hypothetical protein ACFFBP_13590 [Promethearchaeota archaeon]
MKAFIYMALLVAMIVIFKQNYILGIILIAVIGGGYIYLKSRKKGGKGIFRSSASIGMQDEAQKLLTFMLLQQLSKNNSSLNSEIKDMNHNEEELDEHDKARQEILKILE